MFSSNGFLKLFYEKFILISYFYFTLRTDQGVHSFKSSAHLDLELPYTCHPNKLVFQVNNFLSSCEVPIKYV